MHTFDTSTPVVVLRSDHHGSLCFVPSLRPIGVPDFGVEIQPDSAGENVSFLCGKVHNRRKRR
jgi:hypothetical protein